MPDLVTEVTETKPTFKVWFKSFLYRIGNFFIRYPLATAATVLLVLGGVFLACFGSKVQIGGILGSLWGKVHPSKFPDAPIVTPPPNRVDDSGKVIEPGQSDDAGYAQAPVVLPIKEPGLFSDPTVISVTRPDGTIAVIPLPSGVKNTDVQELIQVGPNTYQIKNKDTGTDTGKLLGELS